MLKLSDLAPTIGKTATFTKQFNQVSTQSFQRIEIIKQMCQELLPRIDNMRFGHYLINLNAAEHITL